MSESYSAPAATLKRKAAAAELRRLECDDWTDAIRSLVALRIVIAWSSVLDSTTRERMLGAVEKEIRCQME